MQRRNLTAEQLAEEARKIRYVSHAMLGAAEVVAVDTPDAMAIPLPKGTVGVGFASPKDGGAFAVRTRSGAHSLPLYFWLEPGMVIAGDDIEALLPSRCARLPLAFFVARTQPCTETDR